MYRNIIISFIAGAITGAAAVYFAMKGKVDADSEALREAIKKLDASKYDSKEKTEKIKKDDDDILKYAKVLAEEKYEAPSNEEEVDAPYMITMADYGDKINKYDSPYLTKSYNLYSDGVVTDEDDEPLKDVEEELGTDYISFFEKTGADIAYVRNDALEIDYEIVKMDEEYGYSPSDSPDARHLKRGIDYDDEYEDDE